MKNYEKFLMFDIETTGKASSFQNFMEQDKRGGELFQKKYLKMKFTNPDNKSWNCSIEEAWRNNSPLLPEFGIILCISYGFLNPKTNEFKVKSIFIKDKTEKELLQEAKQIFEKAKILGLILTGQNIKGFDIPFIVKRMIINGIVIPSILNTYNKKPWETSFVDTMEVWKGLSWTPTSLEEITYALNVPTPKDQLSGEHVFETYWFENDIDAICTYCEKDVQALYDICEKIFSSF